MDRVAPGRSAHDTRRSKVKLPLVDSADGAAPSPSGSSDILHQAFAHPLPTSHEERGQVTGRLRPSSRYRYLPKDSSTCLNGILRLLVGGLFVFAGVLKMADPAKFAIDVSNYRLLPHELINLVAILLPGIEVVAGLFVLTGLRLKAAALVVTGLTVIFFIAIVSALARGLNIECGCFGTVGGKHIGLLTLAIDSTLFCLAALLAKRAGRRL
jgi:putative oxidoreductase